MGAAAAGPGGPNANKRAGRRPSAFAADIRRTITGNIKVFLSLFVICALGSGVFVALKASCDDLRLAADAYFDAQHLYDLSIQSTLGLTQDDVGALAALDNVEAAEGGYTETAYTEVGGAPEQVSLRALSDTGMNEPQLVSGWLPSGPGEVAVTQKFLDATGKQVGDTLTFASDAALGTGDSGATDSGAGTATATDASDTATSPEVFTRRIYIITGAVRDPMDVNSDQNTMSFRTSSTVKYAFFFARDAVEHADTFTVAYLAVKGARELPCYGDAYQDLIDQVKDETDAIRQEREDARTASVRGDASQAIDEQGQAAEQQLAEAEQRLARSQDAIAEGKGEVASGKRELAEQEQTAEEQLAAGRQELADARAQLDEKLADAYAQTEQEVRSRAQAAIPSTVQSTLVNMAEYQQLSAAKSQLEAQTAARAAAQARLDELAAKESRGERLTEQELRERQNKTAEVEAANQAIVALQAQTGMDAQGMAAALAQMEAAVTKSVKQGVEQALSAQVEAAKQQVYEQHFKAAYVQLDEGEQVLEEQGASAAEQLQAAREKLAAAEQELAAGQREVDAGQTTLAEERTTATEALDEARGKVDEIEPATWYIQDRTALSSYASLGSDADSIEAIATVFPLIFLAVAVLIALTTIARMVEEDRGLIGLYKALGYRRAQIQAKYAVYALAASLLGCIAGGVLGFVVLPLVLFTVFDTMYALPALHLHFNPIYALWGSTLFIGAIVGSALISCRRVLREAPASLMRPLAPRAGSRIFLERITPVWRRLSFLNKVTARNLFRYKKRFLMTVLGIAGCSALMICGMGIRDTVASFKERQYGEAGVTRYDLLTVAADTDADAARDLLATTSGVKDLLACRVDSVTAEFNGKRETVQLVVVPDDVDLSSYVHLTDPAGAALELPDTGARALITKNAEQVLGFAAGDTIRLQDSELRQGEVEIAGIQLNYLGNYCYMTESAYRAAFGRDAVRNACLAHLSGSEAEQIDVADALAEHGVFLSISSTAKISNQFTESFKIIDTVVYVLTIMAACLAFAVVFTLSTTNISERERELATIKVLGFRRREVHRYINKETVILALFGIAAGCPLGWGLTRFLSWVLRMPSLYFDAVVEPGTYAVAGALSLVFVLVINKITDRSLDRIVMVEALKSAE